MTRRKSLEAAKREFDRIAPFCCEPFFRVEVVPPRYARRKRSDDKYNIDALPNVIGSLKLFGHKCAIQVPFGGFNAKAIALFVAACDRGISALPLCEKIDSKICGQENAASKWMAFLFMQDDGIVWREHVVGGDLPGLLWMKWPKPADASSVAIQLILEAMPEPKRRSRITVKA